MSELPDIEFGEDDKQRNVETLRPRAVGSPLAMGLSSRAAQADYRVAPSLPQPAEDSAASQADSPAGEDAGDNPSGLQRAIGGLRMAWPFVQKILPLLDGQVVTAISNLLSPHHAPQAQVNLAPIENSLTQLHTRHSELLDQVAEQNTSLKRVEDRLEQVREATDRNTLEQQELMQDLKSVGRKVNRIAIVAMLLLLISIALNAVLYLHIVHVLP
jgi:hypothetical protein